LAKDERAPGQQLRIAVRFLPTDSFVFLSLGLLSAKKEECPDKTQQDAITGLSNTNQVEKSHAAMELRCGFMIHDLLFVSSAL
jgi:hypothetical protein